MKKRVILLSIIAVSIGIIAVYFGYKKQPRKFKQLIAARYYTNYAWGYSFNGYALFADGSIYTWSEHSDNYKNNEEYDIDTYNGLKNYVLNKAKKLDYKVSELDLNQINKYLLNITKASTYFEKNNYMYDFGEEYTYVYKDNTPFLIKEYGDWEGVSSDKNAIKLIEIIDKIISSQKN